MAEGNLDPIVRALVGVDRQCLGTVADIANRLNSPDACRWHDRLNEVLQEGLPPLEPPPLLVFDDQRVATVDLSAPHDPHAFWRDTREAPARSVWDSFVSLVVAKAQVRAPAGIVRIPYADLSRAALVRDILAGPGVGNFDPTDLCAIIAATIAKQPNGEAGDLLNDGRANLFPCGPVLVRVGWNGAGRRWSVGCWSPGGDVGAGRRVFSGNLIR